MNQQEFKSRTGEFLTADEINRYAEWYEPAYMAAQGIDKDDFCAILKDKAVRVFVREVSMAFLRDESRNAALLDQIERKDILLRARDAKIDRYRNALLLVSATCDRAGVQCGEN